MRQVADKAQVATQRSWKRPYGVGLLVAGFDKSGAKLFYNCPSGNFYEYKANAIGARSQVTAVTRGSLRVCRPDSGCSPNSTELVDVTAGCEDVLGAQI